MAILQPRCKIGNYLVDVFVKDGEINETYRVSALDAPFGTYFMKLYDPERFKARLNARDGKVPEIELMRGVSGDFLISYVDDGVYFNPADGKEYPYIITNYFSGRLLSEMLGYDAMPFSFDDIRRIYTQLLKGLESLHSRGLVHNDITPRNVMFDPATMATQIIDMGHVARAGSFEHNYLTTDLEPYYRSPEGFSNANDPAGDVFSASAVVYALLTGHAPWQGAVDAVEDGDERKFKTALHLARKKPLAFDGAPADTPQWLKDVIAGALAVKKADRLDAAAILNALSEQKSPFDSPVADTGATAKPAKPGIKRQRSAEPENGPEPEVAPKRGNGFADVAGMDELKDMLQKKVLFILKNKEKAQQYKLTPPNGMLLYGPPGCGKTYFAEKFAEESGFNYKFIKASDLGSIYVHGGQGKIAELFDKARKKAPMVICFDEFDAMVPDRSSRGAEHIAGEVNEFLSQLNNCAKDGIFVIGTTNQPEMIDRAILRKGRLDISVYIPEPDEQTRRLMFDLYLKDRPCDTIDTERLAKLTERYVASDIAFIVNDAAMIAAFRDELITQQGLEDSIKSTRPSLTDDMLKNYAASREKLENTSRSSARPRVGFMQYD